MNKDAELAIRIPDSEKPRVVIIGGGFAGINLAKTINTKHIQVVMVDRNN
ncbi:MAG: FAD-dependent oxidoreductase, partial [Bacteroidetes bacterium]|nr:FAD-dependent oxidoreductase [Bacteroidota bacterium]